MNVVRTRVFVLVLAVTLAISFSARLNAQDEGDAWGKKNPLGS